VKVYELRLYVETDDSLDDVTIVNELYGACEAVPFAFTVEAVHKKYTTVDEIDALAGQIHAGQLDKIGIPYIEHVRAVAAGLAPFGTELQMAGLLHDAIEDTDWTADALRYAGVQSRVVRTVEAVTNDPGLTYADQIAFIALDRPATLVKIADNAHNTRQDRMAKLPEETRSRLTRKYQQARQVLWPAVGREDVRKIVEIVNPALLAEL
jgi:(p)ppGpp synthase/HD superfamily hydrolase